MLKSSINDGSLKLWLKQEIFESCGLDACVLQPTIRNEEFLSVANLFLFS
jgi:hypothetical protein